MIKLNNVQSINLTIEKIRKEYLDFISSKNMDNTFDNCNSYLSLQHPVQVSKSEFGVSTRYELARLISNKEPNVFS